MRAFNKVFVVAMPRCATVTMSDALGMLGIRTAHLGRIYGELSSEHNDPKRLARVYEQMQADDYDFDLLKLCDGLADYPVCCLDVVRRLDLAFPGSLFINVTRGENLQRWIQSVERQFVGLQLIKSGQESSPLDRQFMEVMLAMREQTFGAAKFSAQPYLDAYRRYQSQLAEHFDGRDDFLTCELSELAQRGFEILESFLDCPAASGGRDFPNSNQHSNRPYQAFMAALADGSLESQTGITPILAPK